MDTITDDEARQMMQEHDRRTASEGLKALDARVKRLERIIESQEFKDAMNEAKYQRQKREDI